MGERIIVLNSFHQARRNGYHVGSKNGKTTLAHKREVGRCFIDKTRQCVPVVFK